MSFSNLILFIIRVSGALQRELDEFFKALNRRDIKIREVTKGALSQARAKLNEWAFIRLNEIAVNTFYEESEYYVWHGMRTLGVDGTRLVLPNHPSIVKEFGQHSFGPKADSPRPLALASVLYDVLNLIPIDSQLAPYSNSEGDLLAKHLGKVKPGDLLLLDRGYPCFWLLFMLKARGIEFCMRLKDDWWLKVKDLAQSDKDECLVTFSLPKKDRSKLADYPHMLDDTITCRLIKVVLANGDKQILCTSLTDCEKYPYEAFDGLYHLRWNEEEAYKLFKCRIQIEDFSSKTARGIKQDFHSKILLMTLTAAYAHPVEERVRAEYKADENRKHDQKINRTNAISMTMEILIPVLLRKQYKLAFAAFDNIVSKTREIIRPGKSEPRKHKPKKTYSMNYKRL